VVVNVVRGIFGIFGEAKTNLFPDFVIYSGMKHLFYILFFTACNSYPQGSIAEMPTMYFSSYKVTQSDKDSIYQAVFNNNIVHKNIENNFSSPGLLYTLSYDLELKSILENKSVKNTDKKKLLINRIIKDFGKYGKRPDSPTLFEELEIKTRQETLVNFREINSSVFSWLLYVVDGVPSAIINQAGYQQLLKALNNMEISEIVFLNPDECARLNFDNALYGVIIIKSKT
jgi:hypothetical protein